MLASPIPLGQTRQLGTDPSIHFTPTHADGASNYASCDISMASGGGHCVQGQQQEWQQQYSSREGNAGGQVLWPVGMKHANGGNMPRPNSSQTPLIDPGAPVDMDLYYGA